jgi:signal transduction histidine kinase
VRVRKDGSSFWANVVMDALKDDDNQLIGFAKITRDITERIEAERALRESEQRYRERAELLLLESERRYQQIFNTVGVAIWEEDLSGVKAAIDDLKVQGVEDVGQYLASHPACVQQLLSMTKIVDANETALELFGTRSKDELLVSLDKIFLPEARDVFIGELIAIAEGRSSFESEANLQTLGGSKLVVIYTITIPPNLATLNRALVSITDITDRRRAQESLQQAQEGLARVNRVILLGEMTAAIAHEVRQPIAGTVINASAGLRWLAAQPPDIEETRQAHERIVADGKRAGEVIGRIQALVKKVPPRKDRLNVNEAILEVIAMTQIELQRNRVRLQTRLSSGLPFVPADRVQLQQVILNLIINAIEAMSGVADRPRELVVGSARTDSNDVLVEVRDSGLGLDPADLHRLFRSFYTTKAGGMGMGLAISRSIVEAHVGRLWATPNTPDGAVFRFTLSVAEEPSTDQVQLPT